ncbi:MAG TPA: alpha/beta hydrolase [Mycobacteriales bacterium]
MTARTLPYDLIGTGPRRVLVLHGWLGDRTSFDAIRPHLDTAAFTYCLVDYRGYGQARGVTGEYTVEEVAGDALATVDTLGWTDFAVVGHSMGGMAAQSLLVAAPERVRALVGISPVPASGVPFDEQGWALFVGAADEPGNRRAIIDLTTGNQLPAAWLDAMVNRSVARSDTAAFRRYLDSWARTDFHQRIDGNTVPVLVLTGAHDPALSAEVMRATWLRWYPNCELVEFAEAGHYAPDEVPLALVSTVERFLSGW